MVREVKVSWGGGHRWDLPGTRSGFSDLEEIPVWKKKSRSEKKKEGGHEDRDQSNFSDPARGRKSSSKLGNEPHGR